MSEHTTPERKRPGAAPGPKDALRTERLPVMLTSAEYSALEQVARKQGISMAEVLRRAARQVGALPDEEHQPAARAAPAREETQP